MKSFKEKPEVAGTYQIVCCDGDCCRFSYFNGAFWYTVEASVEEAEESTMISPILSDEKQKVYIGWLPHQVEIEPVDNPLEEKVIDLLRNKEYNKIIELMQIFKE